jgi:hypothetical protein
MSHLEVLMLPTSPHVAKSHNTSKSVDMTRGHSTVHSSLGKIFLPPYRPTGGIVLAEHLSVRGSVRTTSGVMLLPMRPIIIENTSPHTRFTVGSEAIFATTIGIKLIERLGLTTFGAGLHRRLAWV